jgi:proteasome lid subunit RPN8/RPN11
MASEPGSQAGHPKSVRFAPKHVKGAALPESAEAPGGGAHRLDLGNYPRTFHRSREENRRSGDCDVWILQTAYRQVVDHLSHNTTREHGGLLLGFEVDTGALQPTVVVAHSLPANHTEGSPTRLEIKENSWAEWDRISDHYARRDGLRRVGWYHSHPGIRIFLSRWDLDVCRAFDRSTHVALVVDPVGNQGGFFVRGEEGFRSDGPQSFYEVHNFLPESIVTWTNVSRVDLPAPPPTRPVNETIDAAAPGVSPRTSPVENRVSIQPQPRQNRKRLSLTVSILGLVLLFSITNTLLAWLVWHRTVQETANRPLQQAVQNTRSNPPAVSPPVAPKPQALATSPMSAPPNTPIPQAPVAKPTTPPVQVAISQAPDSLEAGQTFQFKVNGNPAPKVTWSTPGPGSINQDGLYTAPSTIAKGTPTKVTATSQADNKKAAAVPFNLEPSSEPANKEPAKKNDALGDTGTVSISGGVPTLGPSETMPLSATVKGIENQNVQWSLQPPDAGIIDPKGNYTAPADPKAPEVTITARSERSGKYTSVTVKLSGKPADK